MENLLVSFSGGETSAFMCQYLLKNKSNDYNMVFCFANTSLENEETLIFCQKVSNHFKFKLHYIEANVNMIDGVGNGYKKVSFNKLKRNGEIFEDVIKKHGIPNTNFPHCTRELKSVPIKKFGQDYFKGEPFKMAIGIRYDEIDRQNQNDKLGFIYPLIHMKPTTKPIINFYWSNMPFRLNLKGYEGNCMNCWKKSDNKLLRIAKDFPSRFDFTKSMEEKYSNFVPERRILIANKKGVEIKLPIHFFRKNKSSIDILKASKNFDGQVFDDSKNYNIQFDLFELSDYDLHNESCEVFTECSDN